MESISESATFESKSSSKSMELQAEIDELMLVSASVTHIYRIAVRRVTEVNGNSIARNSQIHHRLEPWMVVRFGQLTVVQ